MKEPIVYPQQSTAAMPHECSEKTCATCFENRGCMFDQYGSAAIHNMEESYTAQKQNGDQRPQIQKQADIHSISSVMQKALTA